MGSVTVDRVVPPAPLRQVGAFRAGHRPLLAGSLAVLLCCVVIVSTWPYRPYPVAAWLPIILAGVVIVAGGTVMWQRAPANRSGMLLVIGGMAWYVGALQLFPHPVAFFIGFCFFTTDIAVLGHVVLALPDGRLRGLGPRVVVVLLYALGPLTQVPRYFDETVLEPQIWGDPGLSDSVWADAGTLSAFLLAVAVLATVGLQWRRAGRPLRRRYSALQLTLCATGCTTVVSSLNTLSNLSESSRRIAMVAVAAGVILTPLAIGLGLLRLRLQRMRVATLVENLARAEHPRAVRDALAKALDDPTLDVLYWLPVRESYVDGAGTPVAQRATAAPERAETVVESHGRPLAKLVHDPALADQRGVVAPVVAAARLALQNAHLEATAQAQLNELRASRMRLVTAADSERRRIQRDLHDGAQHQLLALAMMLGQAEHEGQGPMLALARTHLGELMRELRELTQGILPAVLEEQGLSAALAVLAERAPLPVCLAVPERRWPPDVERTVYFFVTESLANVYKHARASSASVRLTERDGGLVVEVLDDGCGGARAGAGAGSGLQGLEDRAQAAGGSLRVTSGPDRGTCVRLDLPCGS